MLCLHVIHSHCLAAVISNFLISLRCSKHNSPAKAGHKAGHKTVPRYLTRSKSEQDKIHQQTVSILQRAMAVLQLTTLAQFGCGTEHFYKNTLKNTPKGNHYG